MLLSILLILVGVAMLAFSGDKLVVFASALAEKAHLTPAVIGLTVVAAGTSAPELFVSVAAAIKGSPDIAVGNVVGSNISNVTLILGVCAVITTIPVATGLLTMEFPFMLLASWLTLLLARDGLLDRLECAFFLASMVGFLAYSVWIARKNVSQQEQHALEELVPGTVPTLAQRSIWLVLAGLGASLVGLSVGANVLVRGAVELATLAGMSERVVGLTVVAVGTSLPELVASLTAALKKQPDMAVANIVGSNIFNVLGILGVAGLVQPIPVAEGIIHLDVWVMIGTSLLLLVLVLDKRLTRGDGVLLAATFGGYTWWLLRG